MLDKKYIVKGTVQGRREAAGGERPQRKYGVVVLGGITRSESGTARNSFGSLVFTSLKTMIEAIFPQR